MSGTGRPSELHPRRVAIDLGLPVQSGPVEWHDLLDAAVRVYWQKRVDNPGDNRGRPVENVRLTGRIPVNVRRSRRPAGPSDSAGTVREPGGEAA